MKRIILSLFSILLLSGCNSEEDEYMYWTESSDSLIERLDNANIKYKIIDGEIWMTEEENLKATQCCT